MLNFLDGLFRGQPKPLLTQIEHGDIDGITREETQAFKARVGLL